MRELEQQRRLLRLGRISRRAFVQRATMLGLTTAMATSLAAPGLRAEEPKRGGTLRLGMGGGSTTDTMDPALAEDSVAYVQCAATYNYLVELDSQRRPVPELAEDWEAEQGAQRWAFKLRRGVEFHNGKAMTAEDVVYSIRRHLGPDAETAASGIVADIDAVYKDDDHTVIFELKTGNADLPYILSDFHLGIVPDGFSDWSNAVGTGPFTLEHYDPGVESGHRRNPNYWKGDKPYVDEVALTVINDSTARSNALRAGQAHAINRVPRRTASRLAGLGELDIVSSPGGQHYVKVMRADTDPFTDNHIRLALKYAVDREQMVETLLHGYGRVGNDHPIPELDPFFNGELEQRPYDPDRARHHLQQAGVGGFEVTLHTSEAAYPEAVDAAVLYQQAAAAAGIEMEVRREPADGYWSDVWMSVPFCVSYWSGRPTADMMLSMAYTCGADWNDTFFCRERFDRLLAEARVELDESRRRDIYWELQEILHHEGGAVVPMFADFVDGYREGEVGGYGVDYVRELNGARAAERLWLET